MQHSQILENYQLEEINMEKITIAGKVHTLPFPVKYKIESVNYILFIVKPLGNVFFSENVFMFDSKGNYLWQISREIVDRHKSDEYTYFVDGKFDLKENVILWNWDGWKITVNSATGEELSYEFTK